MFEAPSLAILQIHSSIGLKIVEFNKNLQNSGLTMSPERVLQVMRVYGRMGCEMEECKILT